MYENTYIYIYMFTYICIYTHTQTHTHTPTHTLTHTQIQVLDGLLFTGGDGRRLPDLILGTRLISARMKGAGSTDGWQVW